MKSTIFITAILLVLLLLTFFSSSTIGVEEGEEQAEPKYTLVEVYKLEGGVSAVSMSSDGSNYTVAGKGYVSFFNYGAESPSWTFQKKDLVDSMSMSRNGRYIAIGMEHTGIHYFRSVEGDPYWSLISDGPALCLDISDEGDLVTVGTFFGVLYLLDCSNKSIYWVYRYSRHVTVLAVTISGDGKILASGTSDGTIDLFETINNKSILSFKAESFIFSLSSSYDGRVIAAGGNDSYVYCFDALEGKLKWKYRASGSVRSVSTSDDGRYVAAGGYDGGVYIIDARTGELVWNYWVGGKVTAVHLSADGNLVFAGGTEKNLYIFKTRTGELVESVASNFWISSISSAADGSPLIFGSGHEARLITLNSSVMETEPTNGLKPAYVYMYQVIAPASLIAALILILARKRITGKE